jgi:hypothetical protein
MRRLSRLLTILVLPFVIQARDVYYQGDLAPLNILPTFDKGYLAVYEPEHTIALYGPDGSLAYRAKALVPGAKYIDVANAAPEADGSLAIAVQYRIEKLRGGGVAIFDPTGIQSAFIETGTDWLPTQVCFGPDHSIWAIGWRGIAQPATSVVDYFVLRNYARDGRLLGAFLSRSSFEQDPVGRPNVGGWQLRSANGRIGGLFYTTSALKHGAPRRMGEWIEVDLLGKVVRQVEMPEKTIGAFCNDGSLYARGYQGDYSVLNPAGNSWQPFLEATGGTLLGADGGGLVFLIRGTNLLVWSPRR